MSIWDFLLPKKRRYNVLPSRGCSYVTHDETGEPMVTYYMPNNGLFCSERNASYQQHAYFLNIRRPVVFDVEGVSPIVIPNDLPEECDGIIFLNYGRTGKKAFFVRDKSSQAMCADEGAFGGPFVG